MSILQMKKQKHIERKQPTQSHTALEPLTEVRAQPSLPKVLALCPLAVRLFA